MNIRPLDTERRQFYDAKPEERCALIKDIAETCYKAWDTWDIGAEPYGVQLAYLFATIAGGNNGWSFSLEMATDEKDPQLVPFADAMKELFGLSHAVWNYIDREWNGLPESACPVCAHDCVGYHPIRHCYECSFDEAIHDFRTYKPNQDAT